MGREPKYKTDAERLAALRDAQRRWAAANPEKVREYQRAYYLRKKSKADA